MADGQPTQTFEPTVLGAMWRYRWLVLFVAVAFSGLGFLYGTSTEEFTATGVIAVQDPRSTNLFEQTLGTPDRYVEDQAAIVGSRIVARGAVDLLAEQDPPIEIDVDSVASDLAVTTNTGSNLITISFAAPTRRDAIAVVNAVEASYQEVSRAAAEATFAIALTELDETLISIQQDLQVLQTEIAAARLGDETRQALAAQLVAARNELLSLEFPGPTASDDALALAAARLNELQLRIATLEAALADDPGNTELALLLGEQAEAQRRLSELQTRRDQIAIDADLAGSGVVWSAPAETAQPSSVGLWVVLGGILGAVFGAALAYLLAVRRRRFTHRTEPERILGVPLMTDVPQFSQERITTRLPVSDAPLSASAEAFRFAATAITVQQIDRAANGGATFKTVAVTSAGLFDGKTTVTANTALAAAREGGRVLVIDADFASQALTDLLISAQERPLGITDIAAGTVTLRNAGIRVTKEYTGTVTLLTRGTVDIAATDFFASNQAQRVLEEAARDFDLVLLDAPPILRVAYATTIVRSADRVVVVVPHRSDVALSEEIHRRLSLIGTPALGYIYNSAPLRPEMTLTAGSMANSLGLQQATRP